MTRCWLESIAQQWLSYVNPTLQWYSQKRCTTLYSLSKYLVLEGVIPGVGRHFHCRWRGENSVVSPFFYLKWSLCKLFVDLLRERHAQRWSNRSGNVDGLNLNKAANFLTRIQSMVIDIYLCFGRDVRGQTQRARRGGRRKNKVVGRHTRKRIASQPSGLSPIPPSPAIWLTEPYCLAGPRTVLADTVLSELSLIVGSNRCKLLFWENRKIIWEFCCLVINNQLIVFFKVEKTFRCWNDLLTCKSLQVLQVFTT